MNTHVDTYDKNTIYNIWQYFLTCGQSHMQTSSLVRLEASGTHRKLISNLRTKFSCSHHLLWLHLLSNPHELYSDCVCVYFIDTISREWIVMTKFMAISDVSVHTVVQSWHTAHKIVSHREALFAAQQSETLIGIYAHACIRLINIFIHIHMVHMQTSLARMAQSARMHKAEEDYSYSICEKPGMHMCTPSAHTLSLGTIQTEL